MLEKRHYKDESLEILRAIEEFIETLSFRNSIYNFKSSGGNEFDKKQGNGEKPNSLLKKIENMINNL